MSWLEGLPYSWQTACTLIGYFMRLASRGGRSLTSTKFRLLGGQITTRGLAPAPFFISLLNCFHEKALPFVRLPKF